MSPRPNKKRPWNRLVPGPFSLSPEGKLIEGYKLSYQRAAVGIAGKIHRHDAIPAKWHAREIVEQQLVRTLKAVARFNTGRQRARPHATGSAGEVDEQVAQPIVSDHLLLKERLDVMLELVRLEPRRKGLVLVLHRVDRPTRRGPLERLIVGPFGQVDTERTGAVFLEAAYQYDAPACVAQRRNILG